LGEKINSYNRCRKLLLGERGRDKKLTKMLNSAKDMQTRNKQIIKAYKQGYSQHSIAKVLGISQPAVNGVIKRSRR
jgi:DNA-directed RNA polymerase specialized sigma subunit